MRVFFLMILIAGLGVGVAYPWWMTNFTGTELGSFAVYSPQDGFRPVTVTLSHVDSPVRVLVDLTTRDDTTRSSPRTLLTLTAATGGRTVLAETLSFSEVKPREESPQNPRLILRDDAGTIEPVGSADYVFTVARGEVEELRIQAVDLILRANVAEADPRALPVGISTTAVGFIGLVLALRRASRRKREAAAPPPAPRWGRGGPTDA